MRESEGEVRVCLACGRPFRELRTVTEPFGEQEAVSPCCGEAWAPAERCDRCGGWMARNSGTHGLCAACAGAAERRFRQLLREEFSGAEREVLNDRFDGVPLTEDGMERCHHERI